MSEYLVKEKGDLMSSDYPREYWIRKSSIKLGDDTRAASIQAHTEEPNEESVCFIEKSAYDNVMKKHADELVSHWEDLLNQEKEKNARLERGIREAIIARGAIEDPHPDTLKMVKILMKTLDDVMDMELKNE